MSCTCQENDACDSCGGKSLLLRAEESIDKARKLTASRYDDVFARQATIILDAAWKELFDARMARRRIL